MLVWSPAGRFYVSAYLQEVSRGPTVALFFFQAEDGIRDLVRSRGLGDVYKRQLIKKHFKQLSSIAIELGVNPDQILHEVLKLPNIPVSYTHLTLPTSDLV